MIRIRKGQRLGPWVLNEKLVETEECQIWTIIHHETKTGDELVLKIRDYSDMKEEIHLAITNFTYPYFPIFNTRLKYASDVCGFIKNYGWYVMKRYQTNIADLDRQVLKKYWKTILLNLSHQTARLHELGFIHTDLKGHNLLFSIEDESPYVSICDFGLIENVYTLQRDGRIENENYYNACGGKYPDKSFGARSDYEALGISIGLRLNKLSHTAIINSPELRLEENLKKILPECIHPYFEILKELPWEAKQISSEVRFKLLSFLTKTEDLHSSEDKGKNEVLPKLS